MNNLGFDQDDLFYVNFNEYKIKFPEIVTLQKELQNSRFEYFERRRLEKLEMARKERENLINSEDLNMKTRSKFENDLKSKSKGSLEEAVSTALNEERKSFERLKKKQVKFCRNIRKWSFLEWYSMN